MHIVQSSIVLTLKVPKAGLPRSSASSKTFTHKEHKENLEACVCFTLKVHF